jgi:hypothetical protein
MIFACFMHKCQHQPAEYMRTKILPELVPLVNPVLSMSGMCA